MGRAYKPDNTEKISSEQSVKIPVVEEQLQVEKHIVERGKVRVHKEVSEEDLLVSVPFTEEAYNVERILVNRTIDHAPRTRYEGDTMIIPIVREEIIVQKQLVLIEEIHITKREVQKNHDERITLRKENITLERTSPEPDGTIKEKGSALNDRPDLLWENQK